MASNETSILLTADDRTRAAFESAKRGLAGLESATAKVSGLLAGLGVGALAGGGLVAFVKSSIDAADNLNDLAKKTGIAVETLAGFKLAAEQSGTSLDAVGARVARLNSFIGEAQAGNKAYQSTLDQLGITARDPEQALVQLAGAVERMPDPMQRAAVLNQILGRSYQDLVPLLAEGADGLRQMLEDGKALNPVTSDMAAAADKFNDAMARFKTQAEGAGTALGAALLPAMNDILERWGDAIRLSQQHGGFVSLILGGTNPTGDNAENLRNVRQEIEAIQRRLSEEKSPLGKYNLIDGEQLRSRLKDLEALKKSLLEIQQRQALATGAGFENYKIPAKPLQALDIVSPDFQEKLRKALDPSALDTFAGKFSDARAKIAQEYAAIRATFGQQAGGEATSLGVQEQIVNLRGALSSGDNAGAQDALANAKKQLAELAPGGGVDLNYLAKQLQALELAMVDMQESTAAKAKETLVNTFAGIADQVAKVKQPELKIDTDLLAKQIKQAVVDAQASLAANPLQVPVVAVPTVAGGGALGVNLSGTATKLGGR